MQGKKTLPVRGYRARYVTTSGQRGRLLLLSPCAFSATATAMRLLGSGFVRLRVRPAFA